jgi:peptidoglycan/xylan/chitin deacetylase (PgdA/CDA1 family)
VNEIGRRGMSGARVSAAVGCALLVAFFFFPRHAIRLFARLSPQVVFFVATNTPAVALTIDDGPDCQGTPAILDALREHRARATFFVIGEHVEGNEALLSRMRSEGHELANHTFRERMSLLLPSSQLSRELSATHDLLSPFGEIRWFRPGSGLYSSSMIEVANRHGYRLVLGDVYPLDGRLPGSSLHSWYILRHTQPGSIIILHDAKGRGARTAGTLRRVLPALRSRGLQGVTVSELMQTR